MSIIDPYIVSGYDLIGVYLDSHGSGLPFGADIDHRTYKLLFIDVGLMNHLRAAAAR